jgi:hypothetical protein
MGSLPGMTVGKGEAEDEALSTAAGSMIILNDVYEY